MSTPKLAFEMRRLILPLDQLLPIRQIKNPESNLKRYRCIVESIRDSGLVEPLMVYPQKGPGKQYLIMDGHLRYYALMELEKSEADCIVSTDEESYTYNARINRLSPIQEHRMISKAVQSGVAVERIASVLCMKVDYVRSLINLLEGIHEEAADLLKEKPIAPKALSVLKRVTPVRQIEIAQLMVSSNNFGAWYAEALLMGTPKAELRSPKAAKKRANMSAEDIALMEQEMATVTRDFTALEATYSDNMLKLTLAAGYVRRILKNPRALRHIKAKHPDFLPEFECITTAEAL